MSQKVTTGLDNPDLANRLRSYRSRPAAPVAARGQVRHLRQTTVDSWNDVYIKPEVAQLVPAAQPEPVQEEPAPVEPPVVDEPETVPESPASREPEISFEKQFTQQPPASAEPPKKHTPKKRPKGLWMRRALVGMAVTVFLVGAGVAIQGFLLNRQIGSGHAAAQSNSEQQDPDEAEPTEDDINSYVVAPDMPRFISIPKFGTKSRVRAVGVDASNKLQAPANIYDAGWFSETVKPGSPGGTSLIDGHVSGWTQKGAFYRLKDLAAGDQIIVERGDGKQISYRVVATETHDVATMDMSRALLSKNTAKHGLNLITCTGQVKSGTNDYDQRLLVFAEAE